MSASTSLIASSQRMVGTLLTIFQTRLELLSNEVEDAFLRFELVLFYGIISLFLFGIAIMLLTIFLVVLFWDGPRLLILGGLTALFFIAGGWLAYVFIRVSRERPKLFSASLTSLNDDCNALGGQL